MVLHVQTWTPAGSCDQPYSTGLRPPADTLLALWGHHGPCDLARGLSPTPSPGTLCCPPLGPPDCAPLGGEVLTAGLTLGAQATSLLTSVPSPRSPEASGLTLPSAWNVLGLEL